MRIRSEKLYLPGPAGFIRALLLRPSEPTPAEGTQGVLWIHGGGYATGMPEMAYISRAADLVRKYGAVVLAPDYRLSIQTPWPAALEDCWAALRYLKEHAAEWGVRRDQLMVGGESAGGGLTAALCMLARERGEVNIAYQMPLYPMLDDRDTASSRHNRAPVWNTRRNHAAWRLYLSSLRGKEVPPTAAPARQTDYRGLPPAYTYVGEIEPFYCETLEYIRHLREAGVEAEVDVYPRWFHAYDLYFPRSRMSRLAIARFEAHYRYACAHYFAEN